MIGNILLVLGDFDPISNYKLRLVDKALEIETFSSIVFVYESFKGGQDNVFQTDERIALLSSALPNILSPSYLIDGDSFEDIHLSLVKKIQNQQRKHPKTKIFLLLDSQEFSILEQHPDWPIISNLVTLVLYVLPEHKEVTESYSLSSKFVLFINPSDEINALSKASILEVSKDAFNPVIIDYMNKSGECAIKRIKSHLSDARFRHSLRVAGTVKQICEMVEVEDSEFCYDVYLAALYHDICKEIPMDIQQSMAKDILGMEDYVSWKVLHGPIAAWYLKNTYLLNNEDILEAVAQHTVPDEYPKRITMFLYLADRLEVDKKSRYGDGAYETAWSLIENKKPVEAFNFLINYCQEMRAKKKAEQESNSKE